MTIRPKDLSSELTPSSVLHCGECVLDYPATPEVYCWMFSSDPIVCEGCGTELVLEEKTLVD